MAETLGNTIANPEVGVPPSRTFGEFLGSLATGQAPLDAPKAPNFDRDKAEGLDSTALDPEAAGALARSLQPQQKPRTNTGPAAPTARHRRESGDAGTSTGDSKEPEKYTGKRRGKPGRHREGNQAKNEKKSKD